MITCHPKKIPKFLLKGGVVQFCLRKEQLGKDSVILEDMEEEVNLLPMEELKLVNLDNISLNYSEIMNLSSLEETWETTMDT